MTDQNLSNTKQSEGTTPIITNQDINDIAHPVNDAPVKPAVEQIREDRDTDHGNLPFSHGQLLDALYWIQGVFEAGNITMLLVYKTAEDVLAKKALDGDSIHVGVRENEWISGARSTIDSAAQYQSDEGNTVRYLANSGVPVIVHVFKDDPCITSPDTQLYQHEYFKLPNPYSRFKEVYGSE